MKDEIFHGMKTSEIRNILNLILVKSRIKYWNVTAIDKIEIKNVKRYPAAFVINTQKHNVRVCGHWVCLILLDRLHALYFDSLGKPAPTEINRIHPVILNKRQIQSTKSSVCGEYCIYVLYKASRGANFNQLLKIFTRNRIKNDKSVSLFVNKIKKCL